MPETAAGRSLRLRLTHHNNQQRAAATTAHLEARRVEDAVQEAVEDTSQRRRHPEGEVEGVEEVLHVSDRISNSSSDCGGCRKLS